MCDLEKLRCINCGIAKMVFVPNDIKEVIVAEVNIKEGGESHSKAIIDYCVNVDANNFDFFKTLTFQLYKVSRGSIPISIGPPRIIVVSPTVVNIQSFFIYDDKVCKDDLKYIATIRNTTTLGNGKAILSNSNLKIRVF